MAGMKRESEPEGLYRWTAGGSYPDDSGLVTMSETGTFAHSRERLLAYLHMMSVRYPGSRQSIMRAHSDLSGMTGMAHGPGNGWTRQFMVTDIEPNPVITLSLVPEPAQAGVLRREAGKMPKPVGPPRKRAGDALRERYREHIARAYQDGQLSLDVFTERLDQVTAAVYTDELPPLIADLDPLPADAEVATPSRSPARVPPGKLQFVGLGTVMLAFILSVGGLLVNSGVAHVADQGVVPVLVVVGLFLGFIGYGKGGKRP